MRCDFFLLYAQFCSYNYTFWRTRGRILQLSRICYQDLASQPDWKKDHRSLLKPAASSLLYEHSSSFLGQNMLWRPRDSIVVISCKSLLSFYFLHLLLLIWFWHSFHPCGAGASSPFGLFGPYWISMTFWSYLELCWLSNCRRSAI